MKCSFGISDFLEEISSLSHSVVFLYFFALIADEGFLISSCSSLELYIQMFISFLSPLLLFFSQLFVRPPQTAILLFCILFHGDGLDPCLLYNVLLGNQKKRKKKSIRADKSRSSFSHIPHIPYSPRKSHNSSSYQSYNFIHLLYPSQD